MVKNLGLALFPRMVDARLSAFPNDVEALLFPISYFYSGDSSILFTGIPTGKG